jgi:hypothetical protein
LAITSVFNNRIFFGFQLGLDVITKDTEDITEHQEVVEVVDEEEEISKEVCVIRLDLSCTVL